MFDTSCFLNVGSLFSPQALSKLAKHKLGKCTPLLFRSESSYSLSAICVVYFAVTLRKRTDKTQQTVSVATCMSCHAVCTLTVLYIIFGADYCLMIEHSDSFQLRIPRSFQLEPTQVVYCLLIVN